MHVELLGLYQRKRIQLFAFLRVAEEGWTPVPASVSSAPHRLCSLSLADRMQKGKEAQNQVPCTNAFPSLFLGLMGVWDPKVKMTPETPQQPAGFPQIPCKLLVWGTNWNLPIFAGYGNDTRPRIICIEREGSTFPGARFEEGSDAAGLVTRRRKRSSGMQRGWLSEERGFPGPGSGSSKIHSSPLRMSTRKRAEIYLTGLLGLGVPNLPS